MVRGWVSDSDGRSPGRGIPHRQHLQRPRDGFPPPLKRLGVRTTRQHRDHTVPPHPHASPRPSVGRHLARRFRDSHQIQIQHLLLEGGQWWRHGVSDEAPCGGSLSSRRTRGGHLLQLGRSELLRFARGT